jgi:hypothetical protein
VWSGDDLVECKSSGHPSHPFGDTDTHGRTAFEVHQGWNNQSEGCITIQPPDYPTFTRFYLHDNKGTTTVTP